MVTTSSCATASERDRPLSSWLSTGGGGGVGSALPHESSAPRRRRAGRRRQRPRRARFRPLVARERRPAGRPEAPFRPPRQDQEAARGRPRRAPERVGRLAFDDLGAAAPHRGRRAFGARPPAPARDHAGVPGGSEQPSDRRDAGRFGRDRAAAAVTVGVLAAAAVGVITVIPSASATLRALPNAAAPVVVGLQVIVPTVSISAPLGIEQAPDQQVLGNAKKHIADAIVAPATGGDQSSNGCHGNLTGAPPVVPVGTRGAHPAGPPVNPLTGGCKNQ